MSCSGEKETCNCGCTYNNDAVIIQFPTLVKADIIKGKRIIEFEASCALRDFEGDVISQESLMGSADYFLSQGHIDLEHYSELGLLPQYSWLGIKDPSSWIIGKPLEVMDLGNYRTGIKAEIKQHPSGHSDPLVNKYDWVWQQLLNEQGLWKASVYGYPGSDTQEGGCILGTDGQVCATRYLIKSFRWHSTALTRNPINKGIKHPVTIIAAKSFVAKMGNVDKMMLQPTLNTNKVFYREALRKSYFGHMLTDCPETNKGQDVSVRTICGHFMKCEQLPYHLSDVYALATSELIKRIK